MGQSADDFGEETAIWQNRSVFHTREGVHATGTLKNRCLPAACQDFLFDMAKRKKFEVPALPAWWEGSALQRAGMMHEAEVFPMFGVSAATWERRYRLEIPGKTTGTGRVYHKDQFVEWWKRASDQGQDRQDRP